jgi:hypothetical protein
MALSVSGSVASAFCRPGLLTAAFKPSIAFRNDLPKPSKSTSFKLAMISAAACCACSSVVGIVGISFSSASSGATITTGVSGW